MKKQTRWPSESAIRNATPISLMGLDHPEGTYVRQGKDWDRYQACRHDTFTLVALEHHHTGEDDIGYTRQEDYLKLSFWLSGKHTTILDGLGEYEHDRPEVFITSGPREMIKMDLLNRDAQMACVALCVLPDFFPRQMGLATEELPEPLRTMLAGEERPYGFCRFPLMPELTAAARAILAAPFSVRRQGVYAQAKAVELMCLLINNIESDTRTEGAGCQTRHESRLHEAREILTQHYPEAVTLERIAKQVGLNRMALTSGFRRLFGLSVHDYLQKVRMERAYELLQSEHTQSIHRIAEAVGYSHSCNFSTAFHAYFGYPPQKVRLTQR